MKNLFLGIIVLGLVSVSCKKDEKATYVKDDAATQQTPVANNTSKTSLMDQAGIATNPNQNLTQVTPPGMNPPHGQPGHRCDIPEGKPLNSAPTNATQNINVSQNQPIQIDPKAGKVITTTSQAAPTKTAPGMNPPHGEPGHRCDISVGQPLNSKPTTTTQVVQNTPTPQPITAPVGVGAKPKLNPAHGEPFHDCAKQVGEAL